MLAVDRRRGDHEVVGRQRHLAAPKELKTVENVDDAEVLGRPFINHDDSEAAHHSAYGTVRGAIVHVEAGKRDGPRHTRRADVRLHERGDVFEAPIKRILRPVEGEGGGEGSIRGQIEHAPIGGEGNLVIRETDGIRRGSVVEICLPHGRIVCRVRLRRQGRERRGCARRDRAGVRIRRAKCPTRGGEVEVAGKAAEKRHAFCPSIVRTEREEEEREYQITAQHTRRDHRHRLHGNRGLNPKVNQMLSLTIGRRGNGDRRPARPTTSAAAEHPVSRSRAPAARCCGAQYPSDAGD